MANAQNSLGPEEGNRFSFILWFRERRGDSSCSNLTEEKQTKKLKREMVTGKQTVPGAGAFISSQNDRCGGSACLSARQMWGLYDIISG